MAVEKKMTKNQIVTYLAEKMQMHKLNVENFLNDFVSLSLKETKKNGSCIFPGLGKLVLVSRKRRKGRNPATGESIMIPAKKVLKFRVSKVAKTEIMNLYGKKKAQ